MNGKSYSDINKDDFECGKLSELKLLKSSTPPNNPPSSGSKVTEDDIYCTATIVADKWMVSASHCFDDFENSLQTRNKKRIQIIRDSTE